MWQALPPGLQYMRKNSQHLRQFCILPIPQNQCDQYSDKKLRRFATEVRNHKLLTTTRAKAIVSDFKAQMKTIHSKSG